MGTPMRAQQTTLRLQNGNAYEGSANNTKAPKMGTPIGRISHSQVRGINNGSSFSAEDDTQDSFQDHDLTGRVHEALIFGIR